jgi:hypothetical protein
VRPTYTLIVGKISVTYVLTDSFSSGRKARTGAKGRHLEAPHQCSIQQWCGTFSGDEHISHGDEAKVTADPVESDFADISGPGPVGDGDFDPGHSCLVVPDPPSDITAGRNATFRLWYEASPNEERGRREDYYACTDVTFVAAEDFTESIPCFNVTEEEPRISTDPDVNVTLTSSGSESSTSDSLSASEVASHVADATDVEDEKNGGLSKGGIAGVVIGCVAAAALIIASAVLFIRYRRANYEARRAKEAAVSKFDIELAPSAASNSEERSRG